MHDAVMQQSRHPVAEKSRAYYLYPMLWPRSPASTGTSNSGAATVALGFGYSLRFGKEVRSVDAGQE
jgi:hypothetical protein